MGAVAAHDSERDLVARVREELPYVSTGFAALMRTYESRVMGTCRRLLGNPQDAEDVYQEILLRVFHGLERFKQEASFGTWLFRIVHNECMTCLRKRSRENRLFVAVNEVAEPVAPVTHDYDETGRDIDRVLRRLAFSDREVLTLRYVSELPVADIARLLDLKLSAAKMRLSRAARRFSDELAREAE